MKGIKRNINRVSKVIKEKGFFGFLKRLFEKFFEPLKTLFWFLIFPIAFYKLKRIKIENKEELFNFASQLLFGVIKPLQVKEEILRLIDIAANQRLKIILEIGTSYGGVLFLLAKIASEDAVIISVDLPAKRGGYPGWRKKIYQLFVSKNQKLHLLKEDSHKQSALLKVKDILAGRKVDFLFIDGDHTYDGVKSDFIMYKGLMNDGGIIVFHDIARHPADSGCEVEKFWNEVKGNFRHLEIVEDEKQGWGGIGVLYK